MLYDLAVQQKGKALGGADAYRLAAAVGDDIAEARIVQMGALFVYVDQLDEGEAGDGTYQADLKQTVGIVGMGGAFVSAAYVGTVMP